MGGSESFHACISSPRTLAASLYKSHVDDAKDEVETQRHAAEQDPVDQSLQEINGENAEHRAKARSKSEISLLDGLAREQFGSGAAGANAAGFEQISAVHDVQYLPDVLLDDQNCEVRFAFTYGGAGRSTWRSSAWSRC
jgi:hypothetical protein